MNPEFEMICEFNALLNKWYQESLREENGK
jgi:hypothetical protein